MSDLLKMIFCDAALMRVDFVTEGCLFERTTVPGPARDFSLTVFFGSGPKETDSLLAAFTRL